MRSGLRFPVLGLLLAVSVALFAGAGGAEIELELRKRDPGTGEVLLSREKVDPATLGIVVIDLWNYHWCKTSAARVACLVPRMNRALGIARSLGMQVFLCPTDVADNYVGTPQVEAALAAPLLPLPRVRDPQCPPAADGGGCTCGKERCRGNYGWDGMHPDLVIGEKDLMPNDPQLLYSLAKERGITRLLYLGVHTQVCVLGKSVGILSMMRAGMDCLLARDLTDAHGAYDPERGVTPDGFTASTVVHFEKHLVPTINLVDTLRAAGKWDESWVVDPVRITPWGTRARPHLFEKEILVMLSAPWEPGAAIHYTLDGSAPSPGSREYKAPFPVRETTLLRAAAFKEGKRVCLDSEGFFARLGPEPPLPDVHLSDLKPLRAVGPGHSPSFTDHRFSPGANPPQMDRTNRKEPLVLRGVKYEKGVGVHAPNQLIYELKPEYERFVARAGVDEHVLEVNHGSNVAMYPSVVFKVFVDGRLLAESPVMRISEEPWRFDVKLPSGSRRISLAATDGGNGNREDLANWVNAGFALRR